jgi:exopolyphosphatase/guanosine-5'-triphosphate,3'-diphosphate pyrophosphatase
MPIRLGDDAFTQKRISDIKISQLVKTMIGFNYLLDSFQPLDFMACATSAMREAENGPEISERIFKEAGIKVDIIDGQREAQIIFENKSANMFGGNDAYLYVDIGGGSTEITLSYMINLKILLPLPLNPVLFHLIKRGLRFFL